MVRLFRIFVPSSVLSLLISETVLAFFCYIIAGLFVFEADPLMVLVYSRGLARIALVVGGIVLGIYLLDLYTHFKIESHVLLFQQFCLIVGISFLIQIVLGYVKPAWMLSRWLMIAGSGLALILLPAWRSLYVSMVRKTMQSERVLFLGASSLVRDISKHLNEHPELGLTAIGYLAERGSSTDISAPLPCVGSITQLSEAVQKLAPERIVVGMDERRDALPVGELLTVRFSGIYIQEALAMGEAVLGRVCVRELHPSQLVFSSELGPPAIHLLWKSVSSFVIAVVALIVTAPLLALVAAAVKLSSTGPVLSRQLRVGRGGALFTLYKFRSTYVDAQRGRSLAPTVADAGHVTPLGHWLSKLRLDELPQFVNVLRGEMSIVGPRPERPDYDVILTERIPYYRQRHSVKPGITGWAQINYAHADTIEDTIKKLEFDLYYIKNLGPTLDAYIIFQTLKVVLLGR